MSLKGTNSHTIWFMFQDAAKRTDASTQVVPDDVNQSSEASTEVKLADLTMTCEGHTQTDTWYVTTSEKAVEVTKGSYFDMLLLQDGICVSG